MLRTIAGLAALMVLAGSGAAMAQVATPPKEDVASLRERLEPTMNPAHRPLPRDVAALDRWMAAGADGPLVDRLRAVKDGDAIVLDMNWEQSRIFDGAGLTVVLAYANTLWRVAAAVPEEDGRELKDSAALYSLYALHLVSLDGVKCADDSAPDNRFTQVLAQAQPMLAYLRLLSRADRMNVGSLSLALERATAALRPNDATICSGGLAQYGQDQAAGGAKTAYVPGFKDADVWRPDQDKRRQALPPELTRFLTTPDDGLDPPPPAEPAAVAASPAVQGP